MQNYEKDTVIKALGGKSGIIDSTIPSLLFLTSYNITKNLLICLYVAMSAALILSIFRLIRRDKLIHTFTGFIGVAFCALYAWRTGDPKNFYALSLWKNFGFALFYLVANLIKWPIIGVLLGPILGENFDWRKDPARLRVYLMASWVWVGLFVIRLAVQLPLYHLDYTNALGIANIVLGLPLYFLTLWATWSFIRTVPTTKRSVPN